MTMILADVIEEHLEETGFLWGQRQAALDSRDYVLAELAELEERLAAHVDGLLVGGEEAWGLAGPRLTGDDAGEVFAAAFLALQSGLEPRLDWVMTVFREVDGEGMQGIYDSLCHTSFAGVDDLLLPLLRAEDVMRQALAADILSFRRYPVPLYFLEPLSKSDYPEISAIAIRAMGRLRDTKALDAVNEMILSQGAEPFVANEAWRTGLLLGSDLVAPQCRLALQHNTEMAGDALIMLAINGDVRDLPLLAAALREGKLARKAAMALGTLGAQGGIAPLIGCLADPELGRLAGESFCRITGIDLERAGLARETVAEAAVPAGADQDEDDDDDYVADKDEDLPFPDPEKIKEFWAKQEKVFSRETRYRYGRPYAREVLADVLLQGALPERHNAALELAVLCPGRPLLETRAMAGLQMKMSGQLT